MECCLPPPRHSPVLVDKVVLVWLWPVHFTNDVGDLEDQRQPIAPNDLSQCGVEELRRGRGREGEGQCFLESQAVCTAVRGSLRWAEA